jgi:hypothetical protein
MLIPKMSGDIKYLRNPLVRPAMATGAREAYYCTKRNPRAFMRILGGEIVKMERVNGSALWYISITWDNLKVRNDP